MSAEITRRLFTVVDYMRMGEAGIFRNEDRVELIRGEILAMSPIGPRHGGAVNRAARELMHVVSNDAIVWIQTSIQIDEWSAPEPDIALLEPRDDFYTSRLPRSEDILLVVEIADTSLAYDRGTKARLYAGAGIPEYWIADFSGQRLFVCSNPENGRFTKEQQIGSGGSIAIGRLPDRRITARTFLA